MPSKGNLFEPIGGIKSSWKAKILYNFVYQREEDFKLYCTVSVITISVQGLNLRIDSDIKQLIENSDKPEVRDFVVWT